MDNQRYIEAPDQYTNIEEFIREFTNELNDKFEVNWGLDFTYKGMDYHFCRYPMDSDEEREQFSKLLHRDLSKCIYELGVFNAPVDTEFTMWEGTTMIGWFETMDEVLNNTIIDNRRFKDILLDPQTILTGRD